MESQGRGYPTWDTRGRRATIFPHRGEGRVPATSVPPAWQDSSLSLTQRNQQHRPPLARKRAMCDFRARWPGIVSRNQEKRQELLPKDQSSQDWQAPTVSTCSSAVSLNVTDLESCPSDLLRPPGRLAAGAQSMPQKSLYVTMLNNYLKPESLTRLEKRVKRRTLMMVSQLEQEMEAVRNRRDMLLQDVKELQEEKSRDDADTQPLLEFVRQKKEERQEKYDALWREYFKQCQEVEDRRRQLVYTYASRTADLQKKLRWDGKLQVDLRKQLHTLKPIAGIRESQERKLQDLEQQQASILLSTLSMDREAHIQFLQERDALEKQVEEMNLLESGENITRELKKKVKAWEATAKQVHREFCQGINVENQRVREEMRKLNHQCCKLEARREQLEKRKQQWKEQQWYLEALIRGRQRLQEQREHHQPRKGRCRPQATPRSTRGCPLGGRPRASPK